MSQMSFALSIFPDVTIFKRQKCRLGIPGVSRFIKWIIFKRQEYRLGIPGVSVALNELKRQNVGPEKLKRDCSIFDIASIDVITQFLFRFSHNFFSKMNTSTDQCHSSFLAMPELPRHYDTSSSIFPGQHTIVGEDRRDRTMQLIDEALAIIDDVLPTPAPLKQNCRWKEEGKRQ